MRSPAMLSPRKYLIPNQDDKSHAMSPPRKATIINQYSNRIINEEDPIIPPILEKYPTGYKPLFNDMHYSNKREDELNDYTDNSCTDIDDCFNKLHKNKDEDKYYE